MKARVTGRERERQTIEQTVAEYLAVNPDFFERHLDLLEDLRVPHPSGEAVSLIERQVTGLRGQLKRYKRQLEELVAVARQNDTVNARMHRLTLALIEAGSFDEVITALQDELYDEFQADAVELRLFSSADLALPSTTADPLQETDPVIAAFRQFFELRRPLCGRLKAAQLQYLFGSQAEDIASAALVPLHADDVMGILAIGSRDPQRFRTEMGTDFLVRLGEIVSHALQVYSVPGA